MASTILIDFLGTEDFFDRWSGDPEAKIASVKDWCENTWSQIEDGSGEYDASFFGWGDSVVVPSSSLADSSLKARAQDADGWLRENWHLYGSSDAIVLADYVGGGSHGTHCGLAGSNFYDVAMYDAWFEATGNLLSEYRSVGSAGVAQHELGHMFTGAHIDASTRSNWFSPDETSLMYSPEHEPSCAVDGHPEQVTRWIASCTKSDIREWIDNHL